MAGFIQDGLGSKMKFKIIFCVLITKLRRRLHIVKLKTRDSEIQYSLKDI